MTRTEAVRFLTRHPEKFGRMVGFTKLKELHGKWMRRMLDITAPDMTLQGHRGAYKTTCLSIVLVLILILLPNKRTLFARKTDDDVKEIINQVRKILQAPQVAYFVQVIYGVQLKLTADNAMEISTNLTTDARGTSQLVGMGIGGSITGKHFDFIFTDDIVNMKDRKSKAERERTKLIYQELINIRNPGGRIINTGTPWHKEDAFMLMPEAEKYDCYSTGMLSREEIEALRQSMAPSLFAANYELVHIAAEDALFKDPPVFITQTRAEEILGADSTPADLFRDGIAHIDAAYDGEDYTAFTCGKKVGGKIYLYGRMWRRHVDTVLDFCIAETRRLMCGSVWCEKNADKGYLAREIADRGQPATPYTEKENKYVKISTFLRKWWKDIEWLEGTDIEYINQILSYTEDAEHDDAPDSAACVCRIVDRQSGEDYQSPFARRERGRYAN